MGELAAKTCLPCRGGIPPLGPAEINSFMAQIDDRWEVIAEHHLHRTFTFPDFRTALAFTNRIGELAEEQNHHPDIVLAWGRVEVSIWTHKIDGLHESDFILAAKVDQISAS